MILNSPPPQFGQCRMSISNTRSSSLAQLMQPGRLWADSTSHSATAASAACCSRAGPCGTTIARSLAFGASTPWKRIRCSLGRGISAASRCMNSSGLMTRCVVPSRQAVFSPSTT